MKQIKIVNSVDFALVDDEWYDKLVAMGNWRYAGSGYVVTGVNSCYMHQQVYGPYEGEGFQVDHKDRNKLNNQRTNLRLATHSQQQQNKSQGNISGYKGVSKKRNKWRARIKLNGMKVCLGYFVDSKDAALAYDKAAILHFGEFACLNFPKT